jgi:aspartyl/asparaginyl-tRNA synthetase
MARVRSALSAATHTFFKQHGFLQVHTPVIAASDCEGAGEMFQARTHCNPSLLNELVYVYATVHSKILQSELG